ncbi:MAG: hypothetical protein COV34_01340 [Candidatus Zambryskibacteria bacterium CG10_big_fil_rev_8_21_14_0_10_42_12]|uniref:DUF5671 domain-containing protein n=1 Tax=Candidatus Zambryskibacteria bacterium CG10_big_fil_rev_8_21_14_0_10_42_12 TaxID=1975115 RepID=A0A2H0QVC4_9BACT|nr:MAG: hypothetical protein COV34_01340 [Candidatus Zambryskibacteria bacterium CG10_big_fil_rev_8_21_14_0_10_42_12]
MKKIVLLSTLFAPHLLFAQLITSDFKSFVTSLVNAFLPTLLGIIALILFLYFVWRVAQFILHADSKETRSSASRVFLWGILALFVAASLVAIISFLLGEFGFGVPVIPKLPQ